MTTGERNAPAQLASSTKGDGRLHTSFRHAFAGIHHVLASQRNARIHLGIALVVLALGLWLGLSTLEWAIIAAMVAVVFAAEMFNTAVEALVDLVTERYHPLAKIGKDVAAGAVLVTAALAVIVGLLVLGPHLAQRLWMLLGRP